MKAESTLAWTTGAWTTCSARSGATLPVNAAYARAGNIEIDRGGFSKHGQEIECDLRIELRTRDRLEREQADGLLMQLIHGGLTVCRSGLEERRGDRADGEFSVQLIGGGEKHHGSGMCSDYRRRAEIKLP